MIKNLSKHIASFAVLSVFMMLTLGSMDTDEDTQSVQTQAPSYTLTADELYIEYGKNEVAADAKYKGKVVVVSGRVQSIGKDIMDNAFIVIGSGSLGVQCTFTKGEESSVASLSIGQNVSVKGEVSRKIIYVLVNKCSLQ